MAFLQCLKVARCNATHCQVSYSSLCAAYFVISLLFLFIYYFDCSFTFVHYKEVWLSLAVQLTNAPQKKTSACVLCVCVCVCEREREIGRGQHTHTHKLWSFLPSSLSIPSVSTKLVQISRPVHGLYLLANLFSYHSQQLSSFHGHPELRCNVSEKINRLVEELIFFRRLAHAHSDSDE